MCWRREYNVLEETGTIISHMYCFPTELTSRHPHRRVLLFVLWKGPSAPRRYSAVCSRGSENYRSEGLQDRDESMLYRGMEASCSINVIYCHCIKFWVFWLFRIIHCTCCHERQIHQLKLIYKHTLQCYWTHLCKYAVTYSQHSARFTGFASFGSRLVQRTPAFLYFNNPWLAYGFSYVETWAKTDKYTRKF